MPIQRNNYYADPAIGAGIASLGKAIFGDPQNRVRNAVAAAQGQYYGARTQEALADAQRKQAQLQALQGLGSAFGSALFGQGGSAPQDPAAIIQALPQVLGTAALAYADKPEALGHIFRVLGAASGDDALARRGMVATGVNPSEHFALTPERADDIRAQGFANDQTLEGMRQSGALQRERIASGDRRYAADQSLVGTIYTADQSRAGGLERELIQSGDRRYAADQSLVGTRYTADQSRAGALERERIQSGDRRYNTDVQSSDRRYAVDNSEAGVRSRILRNLLESNPDLATSLLFDPVDVSAGSSIMFAPGDPRIPPGARSEGMGSLFTAPAEARAEKPRVVTPQEAKVLDDLVGFMAPEGFEIPPEARARVLTIASDIYGRPSAEGGGNAQVAVQQAWNEVFGPSPRTEGVGNPFVTNRVVPLPQGQAPAPAPAPAQAAVPPPAQRVPGRVYPTPRGPMVWTGTGWRPAARPDA